MADWAVVRREMLLAWMKIRVYNATTTPVTRAGVYVFCGGDFERPSPLTGCLSALERSGVAVPSFTLEEADFEDVADEWRRGVRSVVSSDVVCRGSAMLVTTSEGWPYSMAQTQCCINMSNGIPASKIKPSLCRWTRIEVDGAMER